MLALPIFPASHPASIVGADELNFCVRDGNRWTLIAINTNSYRWLPAILYVKAPCALTATKEFHISRLLSRTISQPFFLCRRTFGDPYRIRTDVKGVRGLCLNHLTNGPFGAPSRTRTGDPLIKSQLLYQLS